MPNMHCSLGIIFNPPTMNNLSLNITGNRLRAVFALLEQLFGVMPYSEEVLVAAQERAPRVRTDVCIHVMVAQP